MRRKLLFTAFTVLFASHSAFAGNPYVIGLSVAADNAQGRSFGGLFHYSLTDTTSITIDAGITEAQGIPVDIQTGYWDVSLSHDFGPVGIEASIGQWGDREEFASDNGSIGLFRTFGPWRVSADLLRRDLELTFRSNNSPDMVMSADVGANGVLAGLSYTADSGAGIYVNASRYDYDRNVTRLNQFSITRVLSPTSLTLSGGLLEHSASIGGDWPIGERLVSMTISRDRTAVDRVDVDSLALGWLTPVGTRSDMEIGIGVSRDDIDTQYFVSVLFLIYGGIN